MRACLRPLAVAIIAGLFPSLLPAQRLRGTVTEENGSTPVAGAVVLLLDAGGTTVDRDLSNDRGEYSVAARTPGLHRLRVLRIGITPTIVGPFPLAQDGVRNVSLTGRPVQLQAVRITGRSDCRVRPDSAQAAFRAWESVRTALTAAAITEGSRRPFQVRRTLFRQVYDASGRKLLGEERSEATGASTKPFVAAPAEQLARTGYVIDSDTGTIYFAPDAETLISESFADAHCLRTAGAPADTGIRARWMGVVFEPAAGRRLPDVEGTLWLDTSTGELRELEYRYTSLPREQEAGGRLAFLRLPSGGWMVRDWSISMPAIARVTTRAGSALPGSSGGASELRRTGVEVTGGEILEVRDRGVPLWARVRVPLTVRVVQAGTDSGIAGAEVRVDGDGRRVRTGSDGRAVIDSVLPGSRRLRVRLPLYDSLGLGEVTSEASTGDSISIVTLDQSEQLLVPLCSATDSAAAEHAMAYGVVHDRHGQPMDSVHVRATWTSGYQRVAGGMVGNRAEAMATTDARGRYLLCGLPRRQAVMLQAEAPSLGRSHAARIDMGTMWKVAHDIDLSAASLAERSTADSVDFVRLAPVTSRGTRPAIGGIAGFEERRRLKVPGVVFFAQEDFRKRNALRLSEMLRTVPGVRILDDNGTVRAASARGEQVQLSSGGGVQSTPCYYGLAIDDQPQAPSLSLDQVVLEQVHGIEVYRGPSQIPAQFATARLSAGCGLIVIWTRVQ